MWAILNQSTASPNSLQCAKKPSKADLKTGLHAKSEEVARQYTRFYSPSPYRTLVFRHPHVLCGRPQGEQQGSGGK